MNTMVTSWGVMGTVWCAICMGIIRGKTGSFFPELANADPRFDTGLDLLVKDHEVLDETLNRFTRASNRYLNLLDLDPTSADQELGVIHTAGCQIQSLLSRHLQDEEDLIVPIILHHKLRG